MSEMEFPKDNNHQGEGSENIDNNGNQSQLSEESKQLTFDDEKDSDFSDFLNFDHKVYLEDLSFKYKGQNLEYIGHIKGLSKEQ